VGLIARQIEARGIPTLSMTSALSITRAVNPPRAAYLDFPLGHTAGKPHQPALNRSIVRDALAGFEALSQPGEVLMLDYEWADDDAWKDGVMRPRQSGGEHGDQRVGRVAEPQYQTETDRQMAEQALASGGCKSCIWIE
jgi:hypothetical protein